MKLHDKSIKLGSCNYGIIKTHFYTNLYFFLKPKTFLISFTTIQINNEISLLNFFFSLSINFEVSNIIKNNSKIKLVNNSFLQFKLEYSNLNN